MQTIHSHVRHFYKHFFHEILLQRPKQLRPEGAFGMEFINDGQQFLEINTKMNGNSIGREMRQRFVHLWAITLASLHLPQKQNDKIMDE